MFRIVCFLLAALIGSTQSYAGDQKRSGATDPSSLAQQFNRESLAGQPGQGPAHTEAISERSFTGAAAGDWFGISVASAGDVNGDGYSDVIVGAPDNDAVGTNAGRAYIYFGGPGMDLTADVMLSGQATGDLFGICVAGAGDVNGDGYGDVIVGAHYNDAGGSNAGRAYIYYGGSAMNAVVDIILTGAAAEDHFGSCVASTGDVNGDGYSDVIVGANYNDAGGTNAGRAYIYYGGSAMDATADVMLTGQAANDYFGSSVASAGDLNGDGYNDVIVGAPYNDAAGTDAGRAYVFYGGFAMDGTADLTLTRAAAGDNFGNCVAGAGDVNGDGYSDVIVGARGTGGGAGSAFVYYGGATVTYAGGLAGVVADDRFGYSVSSAGDVNGDGYGDVIVGARSNDAGGADAGRAYIYFGSATWDATADVTLTGAAAGDNFGQCAASAGDVNGDGYGDVVVGANLNDAGGTDAGRAYLYMNSLTGTDIPDEFFSGGAAGVRFGYSVAGAGDVNGDGYADVIVGAPNNPAGAANAGRAYICFGGPRMDATPDVTLAGSADYEFGYSVASAGDVNGDGYADVIVGVRAIAQGHPWGRAYIYFGGISMDTTADVTLTVNVSNPSSISVAGAGDVNGDGYSDVIVGALEYGLDACETNIYFGGSLMDATPDVTLKGEAEAGFGVEFAGAGDVNGDGYSDVIVGEPRRMLSYPYPSGNRAHIYFGSAAMDATRDVTLTDESANEYDYFGCSVASAGDVNGDGCSDVIVGANGARRAYIYFGGVGMDTIADITLTGVSAGGFFGTSVASAGDVNGDGYSDVIVGGAPGWIDDSTTAGSAYIYYGGIGMDPSVDATMTGALVADLFGSTIGDAGDVNGDGYSDVIVGAPYNDAGGIDAGRAYLYRSSAPPTCPRIVAVQDIPNDQGGRVTVKWIRSGYDSRGSGCAVDYTIEQSTPPGMSGFNWVQLTTIAGLQRPSYQYLGITPQDSGTSVSGTYYFRVVARVPSQMMMWASPPVPGHSVDNLAPAAVGGLSATLVTSSSVRVHWSANTRDPDLGAYVLYRSTTNGFIPGDSNRVLVLTDTSYLDASLPSASILYYRVRARDIHGNLGDPSPHAAVPLVSTHTYAVADSLNMISVPLTVSDFRKTTLYPTAISQAFAYRTGYATEDTLTNGSGYWLKFPSAQTISLTGVALIGITIPVRTGWNMIGSIGVAVPVSQIVSNPPGQTVSPFYTYASGYSAATSIEPHKGYWVKVNQNGELILNAGGGAGGTVNIVETGEMPPDPPFVTGVSDEKIPTVFALEQNYPNPFNPTTVVSCQLPVAGTVRLAVYDVLGCEVKVLMNERKEPGNYQVKFDASGLASGVYIYRLTAGPFAQSRKMVLLR
jgi:hypothetical protein